MKIYTRVGDQGMTKQISGKMVAKTDAQIVTLGDIDELQSYLGVVVASLQPTQTAIAEELSDIQRKLYELQADISVKRHQTIVPADTEWLEGKIDEYMAATPELKEFILPGGSAAGARLQYARTVARRAERSAVALNTEQTLEPAIMTYLNRLSDYLFALARYVNHQDHYQEVPSKRK
ncbi:ATP:cob(I)alamin adenosyltransferase [Levilactobacillus brevis]|uniref:Corrinoid adenosyltransferase n=1 Tax=Levilactobacillus brevis TaxID=1580 RepID=A0A5B7Y199_LEVBR|nr:cob(I)yrinic acid a,c-diamide adenosyltransferase [Levilactobacillus brevis]AJA80065.1 ATP:cob(I)alamin adenosyltransferase [Levilactobacillus brevis BSO 464]KIO96327.1 ATP:Cob(I)alamin adenosyltransferase [Levilactobacillus brevis]KIP00196.1 ATP:Cob(I)alamin adenosyltransferase [Levilactobacillus brevis]OLF67713.1 ATP:cob(I)alamin adenosyltransferase [Levilactobacillus brevis]QCZ47704.1 ATP:cobalamin adenosyltransferase [Levilactobacillus brevis]